MWNVKVEQMIKLADVKCDFVPALEYRELFSKVVLSCNTKGIFPLGFLIFSSANWLKPALWMENKCLAPSMSYVCNKQITVNAEK